MKYYSVSIGSHIGKLRMNNEDNFYCNGLYNKDISKKSFFYNAKIKTNVLNVFAVFDGMGGINYGEKASLAVTQVLDNYLKAIKKNDMVFDGEYILKKANKVVCKIANNLGEKMGSTAIILMVDGEEAKFYNLGDSRGYLFRNGNFYQMSVDHTEENSMNIIKKQFGIQCEMNKNIGNTLTQYLGIEEEEFILEPAISKTIRIHEKDIFLLCSDGLTNMVSVEEIAEILDKNIELSQKRKCLIEKALIAGGKDNITIILVEV